MTFTENFVEAHPSGVGAYLVVPRGVPYQILRSDITGPGVDGVTPGLIVEGFTTQEERYLDFDMPIGKTVTYTLKVEGAPDETLTFTAESVNTYSAVDDGDAMDAPNPRDALIIYYATRLANLVAQGKLLVRGEGNRANHAQKYPVRAEYQFAESEVPALSLDYAGGEATGGDLGHTFTESTFKIDATLIAATSAERDSARQAIQGLWFDTEWFLEDVGCYESVLSNFDNGLEPLDPPLYTLTWSITGIYAVRRGLKDKPWTMLPYCGWI